MDCSPSPCYCYFDCHYSPDTGEAVLCGQKGLGIVSETPRPNPPISVGIRSTPARVSARDVPDEVFGDFVAPWPGLGEDVRGRGGGTNNPEGLLRGATTSIPSSDRSRSAISCRSDARANRSAIDTGGVVGALDGDSLECNNWPKSGFFSGLFKNKRLAKLDRKNIHLYRKDEI